jgi:ketosteroid isomerase-like protein
VQLVGDERGVLHLRQARPRIAILARGRAEDRLADRGQLARRAGGACGAWVRERVAAVRLPFRAIQAGPLTAIFIAIACAQSPDPAAGHRDGDQQRLIQLESDLASAYGTNDADRLANILADDFIGRWADGSQQTKAEQLLAIRSGKEHQSANEVTSVSARVFGDAAVVTGTNTERSVISGRNATGMYSFTDVFVRRGGRWQLVASQTTRLSLGESHD